MKQTTQPAEAEGKTKGYIGLAELATAIKNPRITLDFPNGLVISRHLAMIANIAIPANELLQKKYKSFEAKGKVPAYDWTRKINVNLNLRDGLKPLMDGSIEAKAEIKIRKVSETEIYFYLNLYPLPEGERPEFLATMNRAQEVAKEGSRHFGPTLANEEVYLHLNPVE